MTKQGASTGDKELQTRIEAYVQQHAETLNITIDKLEWADEFAPVPGPRCSPSFPSL